MILNILILKALQIDIYFVCSINNFFIMLATLYNKLKTYITSFISFISIFKRLIRGIYLINFIKSNNFFFSFFFLIKKDKVANFWCSLSVVIKLKEMYNVETLSRLSFLLTFLSVLPSCIHLFLKPTRERLVLCLVIFLKSFFSKSIVFIFKLIFINLKVNCSLIFFLFSFQVHEKSILLATM